MRKTSASRKRFFCQYECLGKSLIDGVFPVFLCHFLCHSCRQMGHYRRMYGANCLTIADSLSIRKPPNLPFYQHFRGFFCGVPGEIRTHGLPLRRRTLYPAELRGQISGNTPGQGAPSAWRKPNAPWCIYTIQTTGNIMPCPATKVKQRCGARQVSGEKK